MAGSTVAPPAAGAPALPGAPTTPTGPSPHGGLAPRGLERSPQSSLSLGRFGRMFRNLPVYDHRPETLTELGRLMIQPLEAGALDKDLGQDDDDENTGKLDHHLRLPAGYTYFGQFVDHDITFDPVSSLTRQNDPDGLTDFRTPRFDLDSLYGRGPSDQPYLYEGDGLHLRLGDTVAPNPEFEGPDLLRAPRSSTAHDEDRRALIGDPRNDENLIVSQLQSTVIQFHNAVIDHLGPKHPQLSKDGLLKLAQQTVRWHYQWVVIHDFLRRLVGSALVDDILEPVSAAHGNGSAPVLFDPHLRFFTWDHEPYMPVEFAVAAYRFGHSMIRPSYFINDVAKTDPPIDGVTRIRLFVRGGEELQSLNGFRPLPGFWGVQWKYFLPDIKDKAGARDQHLPQPSYKIDTELSNPLGALTDAIADAEVLHQGAAPNLAQVLAIRNLLRGRELGVPSGQAVARAMGLTPIKDAKLWDEKPLIGGALSAAARADLTDNAPLWFYVLKEAELLAGAQHLGPVGGRIVAEVLIGLLVGDPLSYVRVAPGWKPDLPGAKVKGDYTLSDLVNFAIEPGRPRFVFGA
jgi:hypothetical protein